MKTTRSDFGQVEGSPIGLFTLCNSNGMEVKVMDYGATITSIQVPDRSGRLLEVACGFDSLEGYFSKNYRANAPYFGCTVGRYCSHIKDGHFTLNGRRYDLAKNAGGNNLHGGEVGFDKRVWIGSIPNPEAAEVLMTLESRDMEEGFPGNVSVNVTFSLSVDNTLSIRYEAKSDAETPLALTNHTYFNLSGFSSNILGHSARIAASRRLVMDKTGAVTGAVIDLECQPDNLWDCKVIGEAQQAIGDGFEHYYVFDKPAFQMAEVAEFGCAETGIGLKVATDELGMLFYTGKYTSDSLMRENGLQYGKFRGFCCETHRFPNGPNLPNSPGTILKPGHVFRSATTFSFTR
ncbi:galactose mutarotase [Algoriphagus sp. H41]|uniref:Aldose 1-epimerase n=1 Tax=Algoriphagus oliviformis TaxID=2811231 RepID=A0ABS3C8M1_9BACT|nr:aldose epimerase family protein [Algoriphagus oliviformis]MBN7813378.1 galactose mutarotase [Algoriphagus oliviformis]